MFNSSGSDESKSDKGSKKKTAEEVETKEQPPKARPVVQDQKPKDEMKESRADEVKEKVNILRFRESL